jgi:hypothetical protein
VRRKETFALVVAAGLMVEPARADEETDIVGTWYVDAETFRSDFERVLESEFAGMPDAIRTQMMRAAKGQVEQTFKNGHAYAEFRPGGEVIFYSADDRPSPGTWSLDGDHIHFERAVRIEGEPGYEGVVDGGIMRVEPDPELPLTVPLTLRRR